MINKDVAFFYQLDDLSRPFYQIERDGGGSGGNQLKFWQAQYKDLTIAIIDSQNNLQLLKLRKTLSYDVIS